MFTATDQKSWQTRAEDIKSVKAATEESGDERRQPDRTGYVKTTEYPLMKEKSGGYLKTTGYLNNSGYLKTTIR